MPYQRGEEILLYIRLIRQGNRSHCHLYVWFKTRSHRPYLHTLHQPVFVKVYSCYSSLLTLHTILQDHLTIGRRVPQRDAKQDWMLTYSSEYNGVTTLRFYRKLNTNDEQGDIVIQVKPIPRKYVYKCYVCHCTNISSSHSV